MSSLTLTGGSSSSLGFFERPVSLRNTDKRLSRIYDASTSLKSSGDFILGSETRTLSVSALSRGIMTDLIDPDFISELWPTLSKMTYLNNAATGIPPKNTFDAMKQYLDNRANAVGNFKETLSNLKETRQLLAQLLGGDYGQYAFVASTSAGINSFAHSIEYPKGSNIVLCDLEFPANYVPWQNVSKIYDVELRIVKWSN